MLIFEDELERYIPQPRADKNIYDKKILDNAISGTTVVALEYKDGSIIAADTRASSGTKVITEKFEKIFHIDNKTLAGVAGMASLALIIVDALRKEIEYYEKTGRSELSFEGKGNILRQILIKFWSLTISGMGVEPILVEQNHVYAFDSFGTLFKTNYYAIGSGRTEAMSRIKDEWRPDLNQKQAILIALKALERAAEDDMPTGKTVIAYALGKSVKRISDKEIEKMKGGDND